MKPIVTFALAAALCVGMAACQKTDAQLTEAARTAVKTKIGKPETASFANEFVSRLSGKPVACGFVSWGDQETGVTGDTPFYVEGRDAVLLTDETFGAFRDAWTTLCEELRSAS